jgi:hypothetical protein
VLSGRGLCDELITRPGESYQLWCVVVCYLETSRKRRSGPASGRSAIGKKCLKRIIHKYYIVFSPTHKGMDFFDSNLRSQTLHTDVRVFSMVQPQFCLFWNGQVILSLFQKHLNFWESNAFAEVSCDLYENGLKRREWLKLRV